MNNLRRHMMMQQGGGGGYMCIFEGYGLGNPYSYLYNLTLRAIPSTGYVSVVVKTGSNRQGHSVSLSSNRVLFKNSYRYKSAYAYVKTGINAIYCNDVIQWSTITEQYYAIAFTGDIGDCWIKDNTEGDYILKDGVIAADCIAYFDLVDVGESSLIISPQD